MMRMKSMGKRKQEKKWSRDPPSFLTGWPFVWLELFPQPLSVFHLDFNHSTTVTFDYYLSVYGDNEPWLVIHSR